MQNELKIDKDLVENYSVDLYYWNFPENDYCKKCNTLLPIKPNTC